MSKDVELKPLLASQEDSSGISRSSSPSDESKPLYSESQSPPTKYGSSTSGDYVNDQDIGPLPTSRWTEITNLLTFWKMKKTNAPSPPRTIYFLRPEMNREEKFCSNRISTSKYNPITFIPRFLFDQFRRYANLFFLFIAILQQIPGVSPTGHFTTIIPLTLVLTATAIKEIIEDIRRFKADNQVNYSKVKVLCKESDFDNWTTAKWVKKRWTEVKVGDIVRVEDRNYFPADLLLLSSSEEHGICFVETSNLDGETNLKIRQAHPSTAELNESNVTDFAKWHVKCEGPNNRLYEFSGNIHQAPPDEVHPLQPDQILLRGAQLRNTGYVTGLVVYTGHDSKLLQNSTQAPLKRSRLEKVTNRQVVSMFIFLLFLALLSSVIFAGVSASSAGHRYLDLEQGGGQRFVGFLKSITTYIILYNNLIPISLIVTLEIVKLVQAFYINMDKDMYDAKTDTPALARNSNLNEELGQVKYVFSDKTGTLTENIMAFKKCSVEGDIYSMDQDAWTSTCLNLPAALREPGPNKEQVEVLKNFLLVLALCHTVIPELNKGTLEYHASSPDEEALVKAAKELGVVFKARTPDAVIVEMDGEEMKYQILNLLEFNSVRKRMSVIVRDPDGIIKLLCKGADSVIYERMQISYPDFSRQTEKHLEQFAVDGLRTLCIAERELDEANYKRWNERYREASVSLTNKEKALDRVAEEIEKDLKLLGATAIEDQLQQGVPEAIASLKEAGIKVWILTGDKQETAINIGFACRQLTKDVKLLILNCSPSMTIKQMIADHLNKYRNTLRGVHKECNAALIIDGKGLLSALADDVKDSFLELALMCRSVICCRVSPLQKAEVVRLVQDKCKDEVTLAIGDGANDVGMIQAAHVGVGISGREGLQATLASDYAIAQFRFLVKLLLVHGAWDYNRLAKIILFSFYKNICLYIIEFWFAMFNLFSGQPLFERWTIGLFNVLFTSLGTFTLGFFEQDVQADTRMRKPHLYRASQEGKYFNSYVFWKWVIFSLYNSIVIFFGVYLLLRFERPFSTNGQVMGLWYVGNTVYTCVVITVNLKLGLESQFWPLLHHIAVWGSIVLWCVFLLVYSHFWPTFPIAEVMVGQDIKLYRSLTFYALFILTPSLAMLPDVTKTVFQKVFYPTDVDRERLKEARRRRGGTRYREVDDDSLVVSYCAQDSSKYADGLEPDEETISPLIPGRAQKFNHGYAFAQEDHGSTNRGTHVQRRMLIRMFDTRKGEAMDGTSV